MFNKTRVTDKPHTPPSPNAPAAMPDLSAPAFGPERADIPAATPARRTTPSVLSSDLTVSGNIRTDGDIQIEGTIEGDIRAHQLVIGETATIRGEIVGDEVVVNGRVIGRVRGLKVRLTASARVEGDIIHKTIAIESGAHFEGSVQRQEDPLAESQTRKLAAPAAL